MITLIKNTENSKQQLFPFHVDKNNSKEESALFTNLVGMVKKPIGNESNAPKENRENTEKGNLLKSIQPQNQDNNQSENNASDNNEISINLNENLPALGEQIGLKLVMPENKGAEKSDGDNNEMITGIMFKDGKIIKNMAFSTPSAASGDLPSATTNSVDNSNLTVAMKEMNADKLNSENIIFANGKGISVSELEKLGFQKLTDQSSLVDTELKKIEEQIQTLINKSLAKAENINVNKQISSANTSKNQNVSENIYQQVNQNPGQETQTDGKNHFSQEASMKPGTAQFTKSVFAKDNHETMINPKISQTAESSTETLNKSELSQKSVAPQTNNQPTEIDMQNASDKSFQSQQNNPAFDKAQVFEKDTVAKMKKSNQSTSTENGSFNHTHPKRNDAEMATTFSKEEANPKEKFVSNTERTSISEKVNTAREASKPSQDQFIKNSNKAPHYSNVNQKSESPENKTNENVFRPSKEKFGENNSVDINNGKQNNKEAAFNDTRLKNTEGVFGNKSIKNSDINTISVHTKNASSTIISEEKSKENPYNANNSIPTSDEQLKTQQNTGKSQTNNYANKTNQFPNEQINNKRSNNFQAQENSQQVAKSESIGQRTDSSIKNNSFDVSQKTNEHVKSQNDSTAFVSKSSEANSTKTTFKNGLSVQNQDTSKNLNLNIPNPEPIKTAAKNNQQQTTTVKVDSESFQFSNKNNQQANTDNSDAIKSAFNTDKVIAENKSQFTNNKQTIESNVMNTDQSEKLTNKKPDNASLGFSNTDKSGNENQKSNVLDNVQLKQTVHANTPKSEKEVIISSNPEIKSKNVNTDLPKTESQNLNQNQTVTKPNVAMSSNTEQESKKINADLFNAESRTVSKNQTNLKNEVKQTSEQIITKESNTNQDSNQDFSQSSRDSHENNDTNETVYNKFTPEKKSTRNETLADKIAQNDEEKQNKINPLAETNPTQKVQTPTPETRSLGYSDIKGVIQKIERMVTEASQNKLNNTSFALDSKEFGKMEIRIRQNSKEDQGVILVENQTIKEQIQKFIPDIQENLNQKGAMISAINVEVNSQNENTDPQSRFSRKRNNRKVDSTNNNYASASEIDTKTTKTRSYGYNTMEVLA